MKTMNKTLIALAVAVTAPAALADVSVTGTLTSDYVFRGISQTDSGPAVQIGVDYENSNGFFAGVWGSNVDFNDDANTELDFFGGYAGETNAFAFDVMYNYYTYQGYNSEDESDYGEILANIYIEDFTFSFGYANDYVQIGESVTYLGGAYDMALPQDFALTLQAGYSMGEDALGDNYIDYSATVAKTFNGFDVTAALIGTDISDDDTADTRVVFAVSRSF